MKGKSMYSVKPKQLFDYTIGIYALGIASNVVKQ